MIPALSHPLARMRVLVVEDESIIAQDIALSLERLGYSVCGICDTGADAVAEARATRPEVVLMDIRLRGAMDGVEAARHIQEQLDIPVVFLTAYADDASLRRTEAIAPYGYVLKPFEERDLHVALVMAQCRKRAYAEVEDRVRERTADLAHAARRTEMLLRRTRQLQSVTAAFAEALRAEEIVEAVFGRVLPALDADGGSISLVVPRREEIEVVWTHGYEQGIIGQGSRFPFSAPIPHAVAARTREPLFLDDAEVIATTYPAYASTSAPSAVLALPLVVADRCLGVLGARYHRPARFDDERRQFALALASQCAQALERVKVVVELHEAVADANRSRAQLEAVFQAMSDGVMVFDMRGDVVLVNDAEARINDFPDAEAMRRNFSSFAEVYELMDPSGRPLPMEQWPLPRVLRGESIDDWELRARRTDIRKEWFFSFSGRPIRDEAGKQVLALVITRDITAKMVAESALRESEAQFRQLAEAVPQIVWISSSSGVTEYLNRHWAEYTGSAGSSRWEATLEFVHPQDRDLVEQTWWRSLRTGEPWQLEYRMRRGRDGACRWFLGHAVPLRRDGEIVRWFGTATDIDDQKQAQISLQKAIDVRDDFIGIAGHELKTPLSALLMHVQSLERSESSPAIRARLAKARAAGLRLEKLINQLLDVSRIASGTLEVVPEQMDLVELVRDVVERQLQYASGKELKIDVRTPPHLTGRWDRARLDQVITNLVGNAIKYGEGRPIEVALDAAGGQAVLRVTDRGIGIAPDRQSRIFERFERAVATREYGGFGLGLWIARQIVEASGGTIEVNSKPREGTTFVVTLPRQAAHQEDASGLH